MRDRRAKAIFRISNKKLHIELVNRQIVSLVVRFSEELGEKIAIEIVSDTPITTARQYMDDMEVLYLQENNRIIKLINLGNFVKELNPAVYEKHYADIVRD